MRRLLSAVVALSFFLACPAPLESEDGGVGGGGGRTGGGTGGSGGGGGATTGGVRWSIDVTSPDIVDAMAVEPAGDLIVAVETQSSGGPAVKTSIQRRAQADGKVIWKYDLPGKRVAALDVSQDGRVAAAVSDGASDFTFVVLNADGSVRRTVTAPQAGFEAPHFDSSGRIWLSIYTLDDTGTFAPSRLGSDAAWFAFGAFDADDFLVATGMTNTSTSLRGLELTGATRWERPLSFQALDPDDSTLFTPRIGGGARTYVQFTSGARDGGFPAVDFGCGGGARRALAALSPDGGCLWAKAISGQSFFPLDRAFSPSANGVVYWDTTQVVEANAEDGLPREVFDGGGPLVVASPGSSAIYVYEASGLSIRRVR